MRLYAAGTLGFAAVFTLILHLKQTEFATYGIWISLAAASGRNIVDYLVKAHQFENKPQA